AHEPVRPRQRAGLLQRQRRIRLHGDRADQALRQRGQLLRRRGRRAAIARSGENSRLPQRQEGAQHGLQRFFLQNADDKHGPLAGKDGLQRRRQGLDAFGVVRAVQNDPRPFRHHFHPPRPGDRLQAAANSLFGQPQRQRRRRGHGPVHGLMRPQQRRAQPPQPAASPAQVKLGAGRVGRPQDYLVVASRRQ